MPIVLTKPVSGGGSGSGVSGLTITTINGQQVLTLVDSTRADKILSVAENPVSWNDNRLLNNHWLKIGNAANAESAYVADFQGTVVGATGHCENVRNNDKIMHLYINNVNKGAIGSLAGPNIEKFITTTLNVDFNQGDEIRLRARDGNTGPIEDTVVKLILKWRG